MRARRTMLALGAWLLVPAGGAWGGVLGADVRSVVDGRVVGGVSADVIQHVRGRSGVSLAGDWRVIVDPFGTGEVTPWSGPRRADDPEAFWSDQPAEPDPARRVEHRFDDAHTLRVPGDWNSQRDELLYYEGPVWYQRGFLVEDPSDGRRRFLCFGAASARARVWVNGVEVGAHAGGFTPFDLEVTDAVRPGANEVVVLVDNTRRPDAIPAMNFDWWNYGGLTRDVLLVDTAPMFVRDWRVGLSEDGARIEGWAGLDGAGSDGARVRVRLPELGIDVEAPADGEGVARFGVPAPDGLERWSPGSARLYDVEFAAGEDGVRDRVGFRTIGTRGADILLNGEPVFLRGICIHEEAMPDGSGRVGRACSEAEARALLGMARDLGCNFVRLAHYPHNEWMVRVADEMGLMVWAEIPVYWRIEFENPETLDSARTMLGEMITRDKNRASVVIWSVGNETGERADGARFRTRLAGFVREVDATRLISAALLARLEWEDDGAGGGRLARMVIDDAFAPAADVLAINEYAGWYYGDVDEIAGIEIVLPVEKPLVISEFGAGVRRGLRGGADEVWTEDFGARLYKHQIAWFESGNVPNLRGVTPWILKDFRSPRRMLYGVQDGFNRKGVLDERGERKLTFDVLRSFYERVRTRYPDGAASDGARPDSPIPSNPSQDRSKEEP